ncbi:hypothetical protein RFI_40034 [Reticulomyxa filosa]|uniref:Uncharacterized protein n=1 Tax=Reticulomyxa filosa TaxID=46433 RepID=X6L8S7_RETFI|nr:hypothetical protein RFI_40034 [Reticulomyxa filosa]|eukprot:ETN97496.1 hypothetical protein RFI_40034 [Reticulomyxa filosa]
MMKYFWTISKKAIEDKERESKEEAEVNNDEDGDKDRKVEHRCAKIIVGLLAIEFEFWETKQALFTILAIWSFPMKNLLKLNCARKNLFQSLIQCICVFILVLF